MPRFTYQSRYEVFGTYTEYADLGADLKSDLKSAQAFIPLDITALREITGNEIPASPGGMLGSDSNPILARVNGATDKALRVEWVADDVAEVQFPPVPLPPDLDAAEDVILHFMVQRDTGTNGCQIDVDAYEGISDTKVEVATTALTTTNVTEVTATLGAGDIAGHPNFLSLTLTPQAHAADALYLYAAAIEYTRKLRTS